MHFHKTLLTSAAMLLVSAATAMAAPLAILQDPTLKIEVNTNDPPVAVWYASPTWLAVGGIVVLLVIVLAVLAARGRDGTTTVVR